MNIRAFAESLPREFWQWGSFNAYPRVPLPYIEVLDKVQGMTTPTNMHLLNCAVRHMEEDECYLEVGTWRGATLIGALLNNTAHGIAIDNDSMDEHDGDERSSQEVWRENVAHFGLTDRTHYVNSSVPEVWAKPGILDGGLAGVYLFDGDKATDEAAYEGISGALPFLAREALIILDDANDIHIRAAAGKLCATYPTHAYKIIDFPTPGNCWPCWWNGVMAIAWRH